jgi:type II restriction/modification system DNA methylase subunit YeeA
MTYSRKTYLERGYQQREIPQLILEKNLFGLDIDERAAQLTSFALMMKGRGDDRRLFERGIQLNVMALVNSDGLDAEGLANAINLADHGLKLADLVELKQLFEHATTFGSLIQVPDGLAEKLSALRRLSEPKGQDMLVAEGLKCLETLVRQSDFLANRHDAVLTNPPYMGIKYMDATLKKFAISLFPDAKSDLFACFIERGYTLGKDGGFNGMVTMQNWMFLSTFEKLRIKILRKKTIKSMAHLGARAFGSISGEVVQTTSFVLQNKTPCNHRPVFFRLVDGGEESKRLALIDGVNRYDGSAQGEFNKIPGSPIAYWADASTRDAFDGCMSFGEIANPCQGMATTNNNLFLRQWHEVGQRNTSYQSLSEADANQSGMKWFPYNKGGPFRKWYDNHSYVVNFANNGRDVCAYIDSTQGAKVAPMAALSIGISIFCLELLGALPALVPLARGLLLRALYLTFKALLVLLTVTFSSHCLG